MAIENLLSNKTLCNKDLFGEIFPTVKKDNNLSHSNDNNLIPTSNSPLKSHSNDKSDFNHGKGNILGYKFFNDKGKYIFDFKGRIYEISNLEKNNIGSMKILIRAKYQNIFYDDTVDFYSAKSRKLFLFSCQEELDLERLVIKKDLSSILLALEEVQEKILASRKEVEDDKYILTDLEEKEALELLKDKYLIKKIVVDLEKSGLVGEQENSLITYLACTSRKLDNPLAVLIQSSSSAGKSTLMDSVLNFFPSEEIIKLSSMTSQSLFYMGREKLKHKVLSISEEEGAESSTYPLKILQSEKKLRIATTGKDPKTGKLQTENYEVEGPVQLILTTTNPEVDEELQNRCLVLSVNENRNQTKLIHQIQRENETLQGQLSKNDKKQIQKVYCNIQRLLKPLMVVNPYANKLKFLDNKLRTRRDHLKYLVLIKTIAFLHQYQRKTKKIKHKNRLVEYIEVQKSDIKLANNLCNKILGKSLDDLSPQTRVFLNSIYDFVIFKCKELKLSLENYRFSRRDLREHMGWSDSSIFRHLSKLIEMEYLLVHKSKRGQALVYELLYNGEGSDGSSFCVKLLED